MRPVLFLDIDGVLVTHDGWRAGHGCGPASGFDPGPLARLNTLCAETKCSLVISSSWRGLPRCKSLLRRLGITASIHRKWRTRERSQEEWDKGYEFRSRGRQIRDWLQANGEPPYAIVDDDSDMLDEQMPRFVRTEFKDGLQDHHCERLKRILLTPR